MAEEAPVIGIDLGTTYSKVAVFLKGKPHIIPNSDGSTLTPSCVAITDKGYLVGEAAKERKAVIPANTIYEIKHIMGRCGDDDLFDLTGTMYWPFKFIAKRDQSKPF